MFPIPWNKAFRKKDGTLVNMEDLGGGGSDLPEHSSEDAGKVLGVDGEGLLEWKTLSGGTKIYYKDYTVRWSGYTELAKFQSSTASGSGFYVCTPSDTGDVSINGYTPISSFAIDKRTGYKMAAFIEKSGDNNNNYKISFTLATKIPDMESVGVRVHYVKNEDLQQLT